VVVCIFAFTAIMVPAVVLKTASALSQSQRYSGFNSAYYVAEGACQHMAVTINKAAIDSKTDNATIFYNDFETKIGLGGTSTLGAGVFSDGATADITIERTLSDGNLRTYRLTSKGNSGGASRTLYMNFDIDFSQINKSDAVYETMGIFTDGSKLNINSGNNFYGTVGTNAVNVTNRGKYYDIVINGVKFKGELVEGMGKTVLMPNIPAIPAFTQYVRDSNFTDGAIYYDDNQKRIENNFNSGTAKLKLTNEKAVYKINNTNNMTGTLEIDCSGKQQTLVLDSITMNTGGKIIAKNGALDLYVVNNIQLSSSCEIIRDTATCNAFNVICYGSQATFNGNSTFTGNLLLKNTFPTLNSGVVFTGNIICSSFDNGAAINSNFTMEGLIYAPGVYANINGGNYRGCLVFDGINFNSGNTVVFVPPNITTLPDETLDYSSGSDGIVFKRSAVKEK